MLRTRALEVCLIDHQCSRALLSLLVPSDRSFALVQSISSLSLVALLLVRIDCSSLILLSCDGSRSRNFSAVSFDVGMYSIVCTANRSREGFVCLIFVLSIVTMTRKVP